MANEGATWERNDRQTPNGGAYTIAYYTDASGDPCPKAAAARMDVLEFAEDGEQVHRAEGPMPRPAALTVPARVVCRPGDDGPPLRRFRERRKA